MVSGCPGLLPLMDHIAHQEVMLGFVKHLLRVAGTALLVYIRRSTDEKKARSMMRFLAKHFGDLLYETWPQIANEFVTTPPRKRRRRCEHTCPILLDSTSDPVLGSDGFVYDRDAILTYLSKGGTTSPMTREMLSLLFRDP